MRGGSGAATPSPTAFLKPYNDGLSPEVRARASMLGLGPASPSQAGGGSGGSRAVRPRRKTTDDVQEAAVLLAAPAVAAAAKLDVQEVVQEAARGSGSTQLSDGSEQRPPPVQLPPSV